MAREDTGAVLEGGCNLDASMKDGLELAFAGSAGI
jgi:hypothetical protein